MGHKFGCLLLKERNLKGLFMECFSNLSSTLVNEYFCLRKMENKSYSLAIFLIYQSIKSELVYICIQSLSTYKRGRTKWQFTPTPSYFHPISNAMSLANLDYEVRSGLRSILNLDSSLSKQDPTLNRKYLYELAFEVLSLQLLKNKCNQQKKKNLIRGSAVSIKGQ